MPVIYLDENDEETTADKANYAIVGSKTKTNAGICTCPSCKQKRRVSEFVELGVCKACDKKRHEKSKSVKRRQPSRTGTTKTRRR